MPTLELASAVPRLPVFWSCEGARPVGRAVYLSMSLTGSCLLEISTYPSTVVSVPLCPPWYPFTLKMPAYLAAPWPMPLGGVWPLLCVRPSSICQPGWLTGQIDQLSGEYRSFRLHLLFDILLSFCQFIYFFNYFIIKKDVMLFVFQVHLGMCMTSGLAGYRLVQPRFSNPVLADYLPFPPNTMPLTPKMPAHLAVPWPWSLGGVSLLHCEDVLCSPDLTTVGVTSGSMQRGAVITLVTVG